METTLCTYCQNLAELTRACRGSAARCPLCKTQLFKTEAGATYRLPAGGVPRAKAPRTLIVGGLAVVLVGVAILWPILGAREAERPAVALSNHEPPPATRIAEPLPVPAPVIAVEPVARTKEGHGSLLGVAGKRAPRLAMLAKAFDGSHTEWQPPPPPVAAATPALAPEYESIEMEAANVPVGLGVPTDLKKVPELLHIDLKTMSLEGSSARQKIHTSMKNLAEEITAVNSQGKDAYIRRLKDYREDLAGLPFLLGDACQLDQKASRALAIGSAELSSALGELLESRHTSLSASSSARSFTYFEQMIDHVAGMPESLPAFEQILAPQPAELRMYTVKMAARNDKVAGTKALVRRVLFDPDRGVRAAALEGLSGRPKSSYVDDLVEGFRYPWPPIAGNAAEALVKLKATDQIARLSAMREEPAPESPVERKAAGQTQWTVRELVRVNHHKNCFLCHPPAQPTSTAGNRPRFSREFPVGRVPHPMENLPPPGPVYYSGDANSVFVRADVTYLRQDFSAMLSIANASPWPTEQRFDFFVRTRVISMDEAAWRPRRTLDQSDAGPALRTALDALKAMK